MFTPFLYQPDNCQTINSGILHKKAIFSFEANVCMNYEHSATVLSQSHYLQHYLHKMNGPRFIRDLCEVRTEQRITDRP
jgi:hypothetical protein